jgi:hypothetical protein
MSTRLEQFINDNRDEFDGDEPSPKLWDNIQDKVMPEKKIGAQVVKMNFMRWSAAAAAVILVALGAWFLMRTSHNAEVRPANGGEIAKVEPPVEQKKTNELPPVTKTDTAAKQQIASTDKPAKDEIKKNDVIADPDANAKEELYHFAKLVEIKHRELKSIEKDEPLLYKQFSGDVNKLDSVYHSLETKLSKKQNSEELLEAMIQNLQLQMGLLNHQLRIIKQINHSKKSAYDKAYQSI